MTSRRRSRSSRASAPRSRRETSSTWTAGSPPPIRDDRRSPPARSRGGNSRFPPRAPLPRESRDFARCGSGGPSPPPPISGLRRRTREAGLFMTASAVLVELRGIAKSYGGVQALEDVSFEIHAEMIHALVGENGAGKSTLVKILTGVVQPDEGQLLVDGELQRIGDPQTAHRLGIVAMYQEPTVFPDLTVAENVFAGRSPRTGLRTVDWGAMRSQTARILDDLGVDFGPTTP